MSDRHYDDDDLERLRAPVSDVLGQEIIKVSFDPATQTYVLKEQCDDFFYKELSTSDIQAWIAELSAFVNQHSQSQ